MTTWRAAYDARERCGVRPQLAGNLNLRKLLSIGAVHPAVT